MLLTEECECINWDTCGGKCQLRLYRTSTLFKQIRFQSLFENRHTQRRVPQIVRQIVPKGRLRSGKALLPNCFCFGSRHKNLALSSKDGRGRNSWLQYKHLCEVCRSDAMETQLEVDSWTDGEPVETITNVNRDWIELALPEDQKGLPLASYSAVDRSNHLRFQP